MDRGVFPFDRSHVRNAFQNMMFLIRGACYCRKVAFYKSSALVKYVMSRCAASGEAMMEEKRAGVWVDCTTNTLHVPQNAISSTRSIKCIIASNSVSFCPYRGSHRGVAALGGKTGKQRRRWAPGLSASTIASTTTTTRFCIERAWNHHELAGEPKKMKISAV